MKFSGGLTLDGGLTFTFPIVSAVAGPVSGDATLTLGTLVDWTSNTYFYTANATRVQSGSGIPDHTYDTNNMVWQLFYAHKQIRLPVGSNRWGALARQNGTNTLTLRVIVAPNDNDKNNWSPNVETRIGDTIPSANYLANTLYQVSTLASVTIPANRYFLLGMVNGPFYRNYRRSANNFTAVNNGNAIVTVLNEVYVGPWPSGPLSGIPSQLGGNVTTYLKFASNLYYSAFKFEIV